MAKTFAVVPAAGRGVRMGGAKPKQFLELMGRPILEHTLCALSAAPFLSGVFVVAPEDFQSQAEDLVQRHCMRRPEFFFQRVRNARGEDIGIGLKGSTWPGTAVTVFMSVVPGGAQRQESVYNGLCRLPDDCEWVLIHDGVRPFVSPSLLEATWKAARETGAAIAALPATDTVKRVEGGIVRETLSRDKIWLVQTPQVFRKDIILSAYTQAREQGWSATDDASFVERLGIPIAVIRGETTNVKVTVPEDLEWADWFLCNGPNRERVKET